MQKVKFKSKVLDRDTQIEYPASNDFVKVSDAFAKRLRIADPKGLAYEFEGVEYERAETVQLAPSAEPSDNSELLAEIQKLKDEKEELVAEKLTVENQLTEANKTVEDLNFKLGVKEEELKQAELVISDLSALKEEAKETLFDKPKDKK